MSLAITLGCLWVLAAAIVAMMPMRHQYAPGLTLLVAAPFLLTYIGNQHGWVLALIGLFALISMFRQPLRYFWKTAIWQRVELPKEITEARE